MNQKILEYVDDVILKLSASREFKIKLENELIRHIIIASESTSIEDVINKLDSPKVLADKMSRRLIPEISKELNKIFIQFDKKNMRSNIDYEEVAIAENYEYSYSKDHINKDLCTNEPEKAHHHRHHHKMPGDYVREDNNVNIKLLYIPLIQICSQMERVHLPYVDDRFFY